MASSNDALKTEHRSNGFDTLMTPIENLNIEDEASRCQTPPPPRDLNSRRQDYLQWADYFMALAFLAAKRSKDPCSQVGACIVNQEKKIVGLGYNGFPLGCHDDEFPWKKGDRVDLDSKYMYVCHAEMNAIINKISADVKGCTIYVGLFPCAECAKVIIQSGIKTVVYMSDKHAEKPETKAAKRMFIAAGVGFEQYIPKNTQIVIDFTEIDWNNMTQLPATPRKN